MADERSAHGRLRPDIVAKNEWVAKAYDQFPVDVINLSSHDLRFFADDLSKAVFTQRVQKKPLLSRLVAANTIAESPNLIAPRAFIVHNLPSRDGAKATRVAFIGLTETSPVPPTGFKFLDPAEAARRIMPDARKAADLIVVLGKLNSAEADRIAREAPGIDVIIAGNADSLLESFTPPHYAGNTLVVFTPFETRMIGELRFYRSAQGKFTTKQRFIALDEVLVPADPSAKQLVDAATAAETQARSQSSKLLEDWLASSRTRNVSSDPNEKDRLTARYVSSSACSQCHMAQYVKWSNSAHARATDPLPPRPSEFEIGCLNCHATGSKPTTGNSKAVIANLQAVQCEQCHGPGSLHAANPGKGYGIVENIKMACLSCHTAETNPGFDPKAAWETIKH